MIRLPVTSISLSKSDIDQHLRDIDVFQALVKEGFAKHEVLHYFRDRQKDVGSGHTIDDDDDDDGDNDIDDTVRLASKRLGSLDSSCASTRKLSDSCHRYEPVTPKSNAHRPRGDSCLQGQDSDGATEGTVDVPEIDTVSPSSAILNNVEHSNDVTPATRIRHASQMYAPRQSSLLRHTNNLSSDGESNGSPKLPTTNAQQLAFGSRPLTTYEDHELRCSDEGLHETTEQLESLSLGDRGDVNVFQGERNCEALAEAVYSQAVDPSELLTNGSCTSDRSLSSEGTQRRVTHHETTPRQAPSEQLEDYPSSPPQWNDASQEPWSSQGTSNLQEDGSDSAQDDTRPVLSDEEPGTKIIMPDSPPLCLRSPSSDPVEPDYVGMSFRVYNDSRPQVSQPQTPADVCNRHIIDEHHINYTAPPGMTRYRAQTQERNILEHHYDNDQLSPTIRAIDLRNRRNREFHRGAIVETIRFNRTRRAIQDNTGRERLDHLNLWRDDLDADRVGEENFDLYPSMLRTPATDIARTLNGDQTDFH